MINQQVINSYLNTQFLPGTVSEFYVDLAIVALLSLILAQIYVKFGNSLSNRKAFSNNFIILGLTTMFIITVVKASLALSLGLVGALSIVRFRSAIKEPEELAYLFFVISIGLGIGAGQRFITLLAFAFISLILICKALLTKTYKEQNLFLTISSKEMQKVNLDQIVNVLKKFASLVVLRRIDRAQDYTEAVLYVRFSNLSNLNSAEEALRSMDKGIKVSFIADKGIFS
ncbi:DUF4956 domain-containing protein [Patescibacteria group bacterium]|nr:DUF4956 domain-containing protein [Patescibacteria group bacterium]